MLETLDFVPWSELGHAYGEASEVPGLIRALASPEQEIYQRAIDRLWYTVIHQGTVYSSTAHVVPSFCELLEAPDVQNKPELLQYLASIARGASYCDVHIREKEHRETPEMQQKIAKELSWVQAASDAVSDGFATYLSLLSSPDVELRASAAYTLCRCQSHTTEVIPVMKHYLSVEHSHFVRASLLLSLGQLLEKSEETAFFFAQVLQDEKDPLVQITAAMGWAFAMQEQTSQDTLGVLLQGYELSPDVKEQFSNLPFADFDLDSSISSALRCIGLSISTLVLPTLIRAVRNSDGWSGLALVPNLLYFALGGQKITHGMTISDLSDFQRDALTAIYETEALWTWGNMSFKVGEFFDPILTGPYSHYSIWDRDDVGAFLSGQTVFRD